MLRKIVIALVCFLSRIVLAAHAGADLSFGVGGMVTAPANVDVSLLRAGRQIITRADDASGAWFASAATYENYGLARFDADGRLDPAFGNDGVVQGTIGDSMVKAPVVGGDGKPSCPSATIPVYRAYNNAYPASGGKNPWDSNHRYSTSRADIDAVVGIGWHDEGIVFCVPQ